SHDHSFPPRRSSDLVSGVCSEMMAACMACSSVQKETSGYSPLARLRASTKGSQTRQSSPSPVSRRYSALPTWPKPMIATDLPCRSDEHTSELQSREH